MGLMVLIVGAVSLVVYAVRLTSMWDEHARLAFNAITCGTSEKELVSRFGSPWLVYTMGTSSQFAGWDPERHPARLHVIDGKVLIYEKRFHRAYFYLDSRGAVEAVIIRYDY